MTIIGLMRKANWKNPKDEFDHIVLTMLLYYDIYTKGYFDKVYSKYFKYVNEMWACCPLCEYYKEIMIKDCNVCLLTKNNRHKCGLISSLWYKWYYHDNINAAKQIYLLCKEKAEKLIKSMG